MKVEACLPIINLLIDGLVRRMRCDNVNTSFLTDKGGSAKAEQDHQWETWSSLFPSAVAGMHILFVNVHLPKHLGSRGIEVCVQAFFSYQSSTSNGISRSLALTRASRLFLSGSKLHVLLPCVVRPAVQLWVCRRLSEVFLYFPVSFTGGRLGLFLYHTGT